ncbi:MAG: DEAD/DEAH box helicase family protein [Acidobacteria bacterium]|nr:DEAD/DEAH box helicase family protein [Acidobacteriota bacterium]
MLIIEKISKNYVKQLTEKSSFLSPEEVIKSWDDALKLIEEDIKKDIKGLRKPQLGGIYSALSHWTHSNDVATLVMPTGTGKTETMLSLLVLTKCAKLLVIVPTDALREQIADKFITFGILKKELNVLQESALHPVVGILKSKFIDVEEASKFIDKCNVIVATANILSGLPEDILNVFVDKVSDVYIDEAHHVEARTWLKIRSKFEGKKILQFTATPYREDGKHPAKKIIYNYPLKKAQEEKYFKKIEYRPVWEWDSTKADEAIAEEAVKILREDKKKFPHILLARVQTKKRADKIFDIYEKYKEFRVAKIYSGIRKEVEIRKSITDKNVDIVICVDMLGEGFDLPELKIAAFHDIKKSLPTTIQLVGRFTRNKSDDSKLGTAKIVVNLGAGLAVKDELDALYAQDNDWNELLPQIHQAKTDKEKNYEELMAGFHNVEDFIVSLNSLKPAMSTVIYKNVDGEWNPNNFEKGLGSNGNRELVTEPVINNAKKVFAAVTAEKVFHKWTDSLEVFDRSWKFYLFHWNTDLNLLFIHSSVNDKTMNINLAKAVIGENAQIIDGNDEGKIFRCLDNIKLFRLQNIGLKALLGKLRRFKMSVGVDIAPDLTQGEINKAIKSHVFGVGFENGELTTLGCSYKGRIWSQLTDDIASFTEWCENVGRKVLDDTIDAEQVLRGAIVPRSVSERPPVFPVCIDWNAEMYGNLETHYHFKIDEKEYKFYESELVLLEPLDTGNIKFGLENNNEIIAEFEFEIYKSEKGDFNDFRVIKNSPANDVLIVSGARGTENKLESFFYKTTPEVWFANGSLLEGCALYELKEDLEPYPIEKINSWDWTGVSLGKESQDVNPKIIDSIQYHCIQILKASDYDIIYDDDYSGEMADIVTFKKTDSKILIELFHLKFAKYNKEKKDGEKSLSAAITNLYEVCGQAQKSVRWKFKESREVFEHLFKRKIKRLGGEECPRIEKGTEEKLKEIMQLAKQKLPVEFKIYVVQL